MTTSLLAYSLVAPFAGPSGRAEWPLPPDLDFGRPSAAEADLARLFCPIPCCEYYNLFGGSYRFSFRFDRADIRLRRRTVFYRLRLFGGGAEIMPLWVPVFSIGRNAVFADGWNFSRIPDRFEWPSLVNMRGWLTGETPDLAACLPAIMAGLRAAIRAYERGGEPAEFVVRANRFPHRIRMNAATGRLGTHLAAALRSMIHLFEYKDGDWRLV